MPGVDAAVLALAGFAESVVVKNGADTYEFTYSDYRDWNNPLHPAEAFYAGKMTEKKNGAVVHDITTTVTETGQMYVVMPVPASVKAAIEPTHQPPSWTLSPAAAPATQTAAVATPRRADGKPDLTGNWGRAPNPITGNGRRRCGPTQVKGGGINPEFGCQSGQENFWVEYAWISPSRFGVLGRPIYKPEFWDRIQELDMWTNKYDPVMTCKPLGLPRHGTPRRIIQTDIEVLFFYPINADYGGGNNEYRDIPTDGRARSALAESLGFGVKFLKLRNPLVERQPRDERIEEALRHVVDGAFARRCSSPVIGECSAPSAACRTRSGTTHEDSGDVARCLPPRPPSLPRCDLVAGRRLRLSAAVLPASAPADEGQGPRRYFRTVLREILSSFAIARTLISRRDKILISITASFVADPE